MGRAPSPASSTFKRSLFARRVLGLSRLQTAREQMMLWLADGVELAWLIDADRETVHIYRQGFAAPEIRTGITELAGEGSCGRLCAGPHRYLGRFIAASLDFHTVLLVLRNEPGSY